MSGDKITVRLGRAEDEVTWGASYHRYTIVDAGDADPSFGYDFELALVELRFAVRGLGVRRSRRHREPRVLSLVMVSERLGERVAGYVRNVDKMQVVLCFSRKLVNVQLLGNK